MTSAPGDGIFLYHQRTKHRPNRYARSPGYMDWDNQPIAFRAFDGVRRIKMPLCAGRFEDQPYMSLYSRGHTDAAPVTLENIAAFFELGLGLSAWKSAGGSRWALRMNPSSGNLHPTEGYLVLPAGSDPPAGVYHYNPYGHLLEERTLFPESFTRAFQANAPAPFFLVGLTTIHWRESWKYGERAFRYCQLDTGHALGALRFAAGRLGWAVTPLLDATDAQTGTVLGIDRTPWIVGEKEEPELLAAVHPHDVFAAGWLPESTVADFNALSFTGTPNRLSKETLKWEIIESAAQWSLRVRPGSDEKSKNPPWPPLMNTECAESAEALIRGRRSGQAYDPSGSIPLERFLAILDKTLPRGQAPPFDGFACRANCHLLVFAHRVVGLSPGLYLLVRDPDDAEPLKKRMDPHFLWEAVAAGFPLYRLQSADVRREAAMTCCHQEIAGEGAFCLGMIARFRPAIEKDPAMYRRLFWEAGLIGQVLYLEAEAAGLRGTGIGCFFDDEVHALIGFTDDTFQSLYHFTIGKPIEDARITTLPAYAHLG